MGQGVPELVVDMAPVNRGIHAVGHIGDHKLVRLPVDLLQIEVQGCVIDRGSDLAHAAAQLLQTLAAAVNRGGLVALVCGALAHDVVEGEHIVRVENGPVDGLAGQRQIGGAVGVDHIITGGFKERGAEHFLFQNLRGDLRLQFDQRDDNPAAGGGRCNLLGSLLHIKAKA